MDGFKSLEDQVKELEEMNELFRRKTLELIAENDHLRLQIKKMGDLVSDHTNTILRCLAGTDTCR